MTRWPGVAGHLEKKAESRLAYGKSDAIQEYMSLIERGCGAACCVLRMAGGQLSPHSKLH